MDKAKKIMVLQKILKWMAVLVLKKYNPKIVSITGSVGKTSAKEAIHAVLASCFRARRNEKNYNNEIGLPLTIIGADSGCRSIFGWVKVFLKWIFVVIFPVEYPEILILEMGADRPGDIKYLTSFIKSSVGVLTDVSHSHIEFFKNLESITREKGTLVTNLEENKFAVINTDNTHIESLKDEIKAKVVTFGFSNEAEINATDISFIYDEEKVKGLSFKLNYKGTVIPVRLNNVLAKHLIYAALAGAGVGVCFGLNLVEIAAALENFSPPSGRMKLLAGIKNTLIIDDTYNASPSSVLAALEVLGEIKAFRKIAVLGDMLELGAETEKKHKEIAGKFLEIKGNIFFAVGKRMQLAVTELEKNNFTKENIFFFNNPADAGYKLQEIMAEGDLILIKGSQGMRMEKIVEEIMAEPLKSGELLCRQSPEWRAASFKEV